MRHNQPNHAWKTVEMQSYQDTLFVIVDFAKRYKNDLNEFENWSLREFYEFVHALPYMRDPLGNERVQRPIFTKQILWGLDAGQTRDCDDKTLLLAAFCELKNVDWRMIVSAERLDSVNNPKWSHIYIEVKLLYSNFWTPLDATIPNVGGWSLFAQNEVARKIYYPESFQDAKI